MSAVQESPAVAVPVRRAPAPTYFGAVGGEMLKLARQGWIWAMLALATLLFALLTMVLLQGPFRDAIKQAPTSFMYDIYDIYLNVFDSGVAIVMLIISARLVGMEYSSGTIRVLLGRGAGRLRLLLAKLTALALLGICILAGFLALTTATVYLTVQANGAGAGLASIPSHVWGDLVSCVLIALASVAAAILIGTAAAVVGRSEAFGVAVGLVFFPADNLLTLVCRLLTSITHWGLWAHLTAFLLGPTLNSMPGHLETDHTPHVAFILPLVRVSTTEAWLVIAGWLVGLLLLSLLLTRRRDVLA